MWNSKKKTKMQPKRLKVNRKLMETILYLEIWLCLKAFEEPNQIPSEEGTHMKITIIWFFFTKTPRNDLDNVFSESEVTLQMIVYSTPRQCSYTVLSIREFRQYINIYLYTSTSPSIIPDLANFSWLPSLPQVKIQDLASLSKTLKL